MDRFQVASSQHIVQVVNDSVNVNTKNNNIWSCKLYQDWQSWRKENTGVEFISLNDFATADKKKISDGLRHFIFEIRRKDGKNYPPNTLYNIVCAIARYIRNDRPDIHLLSNDDPDFSYFRKCLDARMKELTSQGIQSERAQASPVSLDDEKQLWESGAFSTTDATGLIHAIYFYNCKAFGLRACDEHRKMDIAQFSFGEDLQGPYVQFSGRDDKIYKGGISDRKMINKSIKQYDTDGNNRSIYKLLRRYISCLQDNGIFAGAFYRRPLHNIVENQPRFGKHPVGINSIRRFLPEAATRAELKGNFTGHSGKVTCATTLFQNNIDEQMIKDRTGHRSDAVRLYKRVHNSQVKKLSSILEPPMLEKTMPDWISLDPVFDFNMKVVLND